MTSFNSTFVSCQVHHYKVKEIRVEQVRRPVIKKCYILHTGKYWPSFYFRFLHQQFSMRKFKTGRIFLFIFEKNPHKHLQANLKLGEIFYWCIKAKVTRNENNYHSIHYQDLTYQHLLVIDRRIVIKCPVCPLLGEDIPNSRAQDVLVNVMVFLGFTQNSQHKSRQPTG